MILEVIIDLICWLCWRVVVRVSCIKLSISHRTFVDAPPYDTNTRFTVVCLATCQHHLLLKESKKCEILCFTVEFPLETLIVSRLFLEYYKQMVDNMKEGF